MLRSYKSQSGCRDISIYIKHAFCISFIWHACFTTPVFEIISVWGDMIIPAEKFQFALHNDVLSFELYVGWLKYVYYKR